MIGDFVLKGTGDEEADCLPHRAVAFFTEENPEFCGDVSSLIGDTSALGADISFSTAGFGDSLGGGVGSGRENLEGATEGDGNGDAGFGDLIDVIDGDLIDSVFGDCCEVLKAPDTILSDFFGTLGEDVLVVSMDSGLGDCLGML